MASLFGFSQKTFKLTVINTDNQPIFKKISYKKVVANKAFLDKELNKVYVSLVNEGYISASIDSIRNDSLAYTAYLRG